MKKSVLVLAVVAGVAAGGSLFAGDIGQLDPVFGALDENRDGVLTVEEAMGNKNLVMRFSRVDRNHDGRIGLAEYLAFAPRR